VNVSVSLEARTLFYGLREHPAAAPAPDLSSLRVEHDEIVRLTAWEPELDALGRAVGDVEGELHGFADGHVERRADGVADGAMAHRRRFIRMRRRRRRVRERQGACY